jgi:hypothetical protein
MESASAPRPLVFISASHKDADWGERLKAALEIDGRTDWWDDSRIAPGRQWADEIQEALAKAHTAVVLLSPAYLDSETARAELAMVAKRAEEPGTVALFPIVVHQCHWNRLEELRDVQVWAMGRPLDVLTDTVLKIELKTIADAVARTALEPPATRLKPVGGPSPADASSTTPFTYSPSAEQVIARARELAERSGRSNVTSSCLLFALTESAREDHGNTSWFVRQAIDRTGKYGAAFETFLADAATQRERNATLEPLGAVSNNFRAAVKAARLIAKQTTRSPVIHTRHLFAALLAAPAEGHEPVARRRLEQLGIDVGELRRDFYAFVRQTVPNDGAEGWLEILGSAARETDGLSRQGPASVSVPVHDGYISGPSGYTSEFVGVGGTRPVSDELGVKGSAHRLAELIALRETKMPLAIGLFGDWGSGKSHFMNLIDRHLKTLATTSQADKQWCCEIVPIYFNAWHYLDANLWASLVTEIFDGLFRYLEPKQDVLETARAQLRDAGGAVARAEEEVTTARAAVTAANAVLVDARQETKSARQAAAGLLNNLEVLVSPATLAQARVQLEEWLGVRAEVATLSQLVAKQRDVASVPGRVRELWRRAWAQPGRWWRIGWIIGSFVVVPAIVWFVGDMSPWLQRVLGTASPYVKLGLGWAIAAITWAGPALTRIQSQLAEMERVQREAEDAATRARNNDPRVIAAEKRVRDAEAAASAAEAGLAQAKATEQRLIQTVDDLLPERRLTRFIEARARSADYRGQLGLVSLARRDFQELSNIFTDREALEAKKKTLAVKEAAALEKLGQSIDRIVLFVDDLDRCQADKVVDVLQAVHLLLAFPLFAVVVGVDQRSLRQSLRTQFTGLHSVEGPEDERPTATPLDYLEKIFHVPFHLQPMKKDGFEDLMAALTKRRELASHAMRPADVAPPSIAASDEVAAQMSAVPAVSVDAATLAGTVAAGNAPPIATSGAPTTEAPVGTAPPKAIGSVPLLDWERTAIKQYHSLVRTPRAAVRFLNTYRLLRAGVAESDWAEFCGDTNLHGEFRIAMLLLAAAAGHPAVARQWFDLLRQKMPHEVQPPDVEADADGWEQFKSMYDGTVGGVTSLAAPSTVATWIDRVEQFAF